MTDRTTIPKQTDKKRKFCSIFSTKGTKTQATPHYSRQNVVNRGGGEQSTNIGQGARRKLYGESSSDDMVDRNEMTEKMDKILEKIGGLEND